MKKRVTALGILFIVAFGVLTLVVPTTASAFPCVACPPRECGPCETYTGDTCLSCGTCVRIKHCKP